MNKTKQCPVCGNDFEPDASRRKYCSQQCYLNSRKAERGLKQKVCPLCGTTFLPRWRKVKYCSEECAKEARRQALSRQVILVCENCGQQYSVCKSQAEKGSRFCSASCRSHWVATHVPRNHKKIIESHGYRFVRVGPKQYIPEHIKIWEDSFGPIPEGYVIHHKNNNPSDNRLENLELLSRGEHMALHNSQTHPNLLSNKIESYIEKLQNLADILGRAPSRREVDAIAGLPATKSFKKYFGSWKAALNHIGLDSLPPGSGAQKIKLKAKSSSNP